MTDTRYALSALTNRLKLMIGRGRVQTGKDDGPVQVLQVILSPKETPDLKRVGEFGFASWPMPGCDAVVMFVSGDRSNGVIVGTNDQAHRLKLENPGEAALFDGFGKSIWLKKDGGIVVEAAGGDVTIQGAANVVVAASTKVTLDVPEVEMTGNLTVDGNITGQGTIGDGTRTMEQDRAIYDSHTHPSGTPNTGPPNQHE